MSTYTFPMRISSKPQRIQNLLQAALTGKSAHGLFADFQLWNRWDEIAGHMIAKNAQPEKWRNGTLTIRVKNSSWVQELGFMKQDLLEKIRKACPQLQITEIRFEVGRLYPKRKLQKPRKRVLDKELNAEELEFIQQACNEVDDEELRTTIEQAMRKHFQSRP